MKPFLIAMAVAGLLSGAPRGLADPLMWEDSDAIPVRDLSLDISQVRLSKLEDTGSLVFEVRFTGDADAERLRILLDVDGPDRGAPESGADYMLEGHRLYRYPQGGQGWTWDSVGPAAVLAEGRRLTCVIPALPDLQRGRWMTETTSQDLTVTDRLPEQGSIPFDASQTPAYEPPILFSPGDVRDLLAYAKFSLSIRMDTELKSVKWEEAEENDARPMEWSPAFATSAVPLLLQIEDALTGESETLVPTRVRRGGDATRFDGTNIGIAWTLRIDPEGEGGVGITGELSATNDRCVRISVSGGVDPIGWVWHDDVRSRRRVDAGSGAFCNSIPGLFGLDGESSVYPLGVLSSESGTTVIETDITEPRTFAISADASNRFFGIRYDLGLTMQTSNFPGRGTFRCFLRSSRGGGDEAFRWAVSDFYARNVDMALRRVPSCGTWMPLGNVLSVSGAQDFGFAFLGRGPGDEGMEFAEKAGMEVFSFTDPGIHWLAMPAGMPRTTGNALDILNIEAGAAGRRGERAASALLGATRDSRMEIAMTFADVPESAGASLAVNTDPDLRPSAALPINRAMSEWRRVKELLSDERVDGIVLGSTELAEGADYNGAAIGVADYPCTFEKTVLRPCVANSLSLFEYTTLLAAALRERNGYLMASSVGAASPFHARLADVHAEEVRWFAGGFTVRPDDRSLNARRMLAGAKPYCIALDASFGELGEGDIRRVFEDCMFWGFLPGFFRVDGSSDSYWNHPEWFERDRHLFTSYIPHIRRIADAGWDPVGFASSPNPDVWMESFGGGEGIRHVTVRNTGAEPVLADIRLSGAAGLTVFVNPLNGDCRLGEGGTAIGLPRGAIALYDVIPVARLDEEILFLRTVGTRAADACVRTLESVRVELDSGAICEAVFAAPAIDGEPNPVELRVRNSGDKALRLDGLKLIGGVYHAGVFSNAVAAAGAEAVASMFFSREDADADGWFELQWSIAGQGGTALCARVFRPEFLPPVELSTPTNRIEMTGTESHLEILARNNGRRERRIAFSWQGDYRSGDSEVSLSAGTSQVVRLPVRTGAKSRWGEMYVTATLDEEKVFAGWFELVRGAE